MKMSLRAIVNKNNSMKFQANAKRVFGFCGIVFEKMTISTYWKEPTQDEYFFSYKINDNFVIPLQNWKELISQLSDGNIVTEDYETEISLNLYPSYDEMLGNDELCFINCDIPKKHCVV